MNEKRQISSYRTKPILSPQLLDIGKLPPQAVELEEAVLGALMLENWVAPAIMDILSERSFYKPANEIIFSACISLFHSNSPIDILTVTQQLKKTGELEIIGGAYYISQLTNKVAGAINAEYHARIIQQKFIQRELIRTSTDNIRDAYEEETDVFDLLEKAEKNLSELTKFTSKKEAETGVKIAKKVISELEEKQKFEAGTWGVQSGLTSLDRITGGWQKSDLIIVAARPAMGKTALVLSMARNTTFDFKRPTAVFSLEMSSAQLTTRLMSSETEINSQRFKNLSKDSPFEDYEWNKINEFTQNISKAPIYIDDTPSLSIFELRRKARELKKEKKIELIIIDYLQLMTVVGESRSNNGNREQEISLISRSLKALAKELEIPIIALSQLSRAIESRGGDKKPVLSDLRESGAIEQDADIVIFIHRPEYYNITEDADGNSTIGLGELIVSKHRNGPCDSAKVRYISHLTKFCDIDSYFPDSTNYGNSIKPSDEF